MGSLLSIVGRTAVAGVTGASMLSGVYPLASYRRAGLPMRSAAKEWAVAIGMTLSRPAGLLGPSMASGPNGAIPLVLVHGYVMNRACFSLLARRLRQRGIGPIHGFEYWTLGSIERAASQLSDTIDELLAQSGAPRVDVVGHSMGGLVARYYVTCLGGAPRVRHLMTVGTPHKGSPGARLAVGRPRQQLAERSSVIAEMDRSPVPSLTSLTAIASHGDALAPGECATFDGAESVLYADVGHLSLLVSPTVASDIADRLV